MRESVLIVDDDADVRDTLTAVLEAHGYQVVAAETVDEALGFLRNDGAACLVILDWMMDGGSGEEVLHALRSEPNLSRIDVIVLTGLPANFHPEGVRVVMKPVELDELLRAVQAACVKK